MDEEQSRLEKVLLKQKNLGDISSVSEDKLNELVEKHKEKHGLDKEAAYVLEDESLTTKQILKETIYFIPNFLKLTYRLTKSKEVNQKDKLIFCGLFAYILNPIDLIPDFIPIIGKLDDLLITSYVLTRFINSGNEKILLKNWDGDPKMIQNINKISDYILEKGPKKVAKKIKNYLNEK